MQSYASPMFEGNEALVILRYLEMRRKAIGHYRRRTLLVADFNSSVLALAVRTGQPTVNTRGSVT
jgi:hypothetical protein